MSTLTDLVSDMMYTSLSLCLGFAQGGCQGCFVKIDICFKYIIVDGKCKAWYTEVVTDCLDYHNKEGVMLRFEVE